VAEGSPRQGGLPDRARLRLPGGVGHRRLGRPHRSRPGRAAAGRGRAEPRPAGGRGRAGAEKEIANVKQKCAMKNKKVLHIVLMTRMDPLLV